MTQINNKTVEVKATAVVAPTTEAVLEKASELVAAREKFETTTLARSNKELYGILGQVHDLFMSACASTECLKDTVKAMKAELAKRNVKVQSNSPALTVFVRYVFNSDRKRAYNYTRTLMAAIKDKKANETLAEFIERKGGVEECKKNLAKKPETLSKETALKDAIADSFMVLEGLMPKETVALPNSSVYLNDGCTYAFVLARQNANNELELLRTVPTTTKAMENAALKEVAKDMLKQREAANDLGKEKHKLKANAAAVASMSVKELEAA
jgi:hypothetical protein